jgi:hypothetical protein
MINYKNRYNDHYTFEKDVDGNIIWKGPFQYCRFGFPNVYDEAYEQYQKDGGKESLLTFKTLVHEWDDAAVSYTELAKKYMPFIYSDTKKIDMVDPSGGPYIASGYDMSNFGEEFAGCVVESFSAVPVGYKIICNHIPTEEMIKIQAKSPELLNQNKDE